MPRKARTAHPAPPTPPAPVIAPSEPENRPSVDSSGNPQIECTIHNVHLGDGRQLNRGERAFCNPVLADLIVGNGQAIYV